MEVIERTPAEVFSPGELIKDEIEARGWSQIELAEVLGRPGRLVSELIAGKRAITPETAKGLGEAFGTGAQFWMNMESAYQLSKVMGDTSNAVSRRAKLYEMAPVKEMIRRQWIQPTENIDVLEKSICSFYGIESLNAQLPQFAHAARMSSSYEEELTPMGTAWLCRVRQLAQQITVKPFSDFGFATAVSLLKQMLRDPESVRQVSGILADAGVRFLIVETLPATKIDGVCLWLDAASPVIALSLRFDRIDGFWHTLLHECAHVMHKDGLAGDVFIDVNLVGDDAATSTNRPPAELRADEFASTFSIPKVELESFISRVKPLFSKIRIQGLAAKLNVHPGLIVGQLQHRQQIPYSHSREMLSRVRHIVTESALTDGFGSLLSQAH